MKKNIFFLGMAFATLSLVGCSNEDGVLVSNEITATASMSINSRTVLGDDYSTITWHADDKIYLFGEGAEATMRLIKGAGTEVATFTGLVNGISSKLDKALYPVPSINGNEYSFELPATRNFNENSEAPLLGNFANGNVSFVNLVSMMRIPLSASANDRVLELLMEGIAGKLIVDVENGTATMEAGATGAVTVNVPAGEACFIDIPVPAKTYTTGYTVTVDGNIIAKSTDPVVLNVDAVKVILNEPQAPEAGSGIDADYVIATSADLLWVAKQVNTGVTFAGKVLAMTADIDLTGINWSPIGSDGKFSGTFDGREHKISNLTVSTEGTASAGLFANAQSGLIKDLTLENVNITGHYKTGAIVGDGICAKVENCHVNGGSVTSTPHLVGVKYDDGNHAGGIVGLLTADGGNASVTGCSVTGLVITAYRDVAGIAGTASGAGFTPTISDNEVSNTTIIADQTVDYVSLKAVNAGEIVGRIEVASTMENNTVGEGVSIGTLVATAAQLDNAINTASYGQTIVLANGTYEGLFDLTDKNLTIQATNKNQAIINGLVWANNCTVTLKGLKLTNSKGVQHPNPTNSKYFTEINKNYPLIGAYTKAAITVDECTLDLTGPTVYGFWGYALNTPVFKNSVFNCNKIRPIANNGDAITVTGCTFNDQYHYSVRIFENSSNRQTVVFTNNIIQGSNDKGEFEGINISKKGTTATIFADFTIRGNTNVKYRHHKNVTMDATCTYETDITNFAFEKEN